MNQLATMALRSRLARLAAIADLPTPGPALIQKSAGSGIVEPLPVGVKDPVAADEVGHMLGDLRLEAGGSQSVAQRTGLVGERGGFALEALDQVDQLLLVPALPFDAGHLAVADGAPLAEVGPLQVADGTGMSGFDAGLEEHRIDGAEAVHGDRDLVAADAGVAHGVPGEEGDGQFAVVDAAGDAAFPIVPVANFLPVDPDLVPALLEVRLETLDQLAVDVMAVAEEDGLRACRAFAQDAVSRFRRIARETLLAGLAFPQAGLGFPGDVGAAAVGASNGGRRSRSWWWYVRDRRRNAVAKDNNYDVESRHCLGRSESHASTGCLHGL